MRKIVALLLLFVMVLPLASCALEDVAETTGEALTDTLEKIETAVDTLDSAKEETATAEETSTYEYPVVTDKITWEDINAFPTANPDMTIEEARKLCVDFFRFAKSFAWTPSATFVFPRNAGGTMDSVDIGTVYGGLPYVGLGSGNIYRTMDYYDTETGVLDMKAAGEDRYLFGNQCSIGAYWGWGRVINSADYSWTYNMVQRRGFLRVGPYTYDDTIYSYSSALNTTKICKNNGEQTMFESYALLQPADGLVYYTTSGHTIMCSAEPVVVRDADGTINGDESYILKIDQGQTWKDYPMSDGSERQVKAGIDTQLTFAKLFSSSYIPFTFAEFLGTDPIEETECVFQYNGPDITVLKMQQVVIKSNYGMSDLYINVKKDDQIVYTAVKRMEEANVRETMFGDAITSGEFLKYMGYDIEVVCQLSTGVRMTIFEGQLVNK